MKPTTIYWRNIVPNPAKFLIILEELGLPYQSNWVELEDLKKEPFESINPNGRVPAIIDPNNVITLFESGAIVAYLVDTYDKDRRLTYDSVPEKFHLQQWSKLPDKAHILDTQHGSAQSRYEKELKGVVGVLDRALKYKGLADRPDGWKIADYPNFKRWHEANLARDSLKKVLSVLHDTEVKNEGGV